MSGTSTRKCLSSQTRETISKVYDFLKKDAEEVKRIASDPLRSQAFIVSELNDHLNSVRKRTAEAVGVSERTITNILGERKACNFKTPYKDRKARAKKVKIDDKVQKINLIVPVDTKTENFHYEPKEILEIMNISKEPEVVIIKQEPEIVDIKQEPT